MPEIVKDEDFKPGMFDHKGPTMNEPIFELADAINKLINDADNDLMAQRALNLVIYVRGYDGLGSFDQKFYMSDSDGLILRCLKSTNPCGTDTWSEGYTCPCAPCQLYVARFALEPRV